MVTTSAAKLPDPRPDGWPLFPLAAAAGLYLAGWAAFPAVWVAAAAAVVAAAAAVGCRAVFHWSTVGPGLCTEATVLPPLLVAGGAWWLATVPGGDPLAAAPALVLWTVAAAAWWSALCLRVPGAVAAERAHPTGDDQPGVDGGPYERILAAAELGARLRVAGVRTVGAGLDIVTLTPRPGAKTVTFTALQGVLERIATETTLYWQEHGHDLEDGDVSVHPGRNMAEYLLHVARVRTLAGPDAVPMALPAEPRSWCGPHTIGMYEDAVPLDVTFCDERTGGKHGMVLGATGSGKGVSLNNVLGAAVACDDVAVWLVGTSKLVKLAWGWSRPWLSGRTAAPVVDRIAGPRVRDALAGLADAYHYADLCNDGEMSDDARRPSPGRAALLVVIDESSDLMERDRDKIACHDGVERNASELVAAIRKVGRTAPVQVVTANQDNLFGSDGSAGSKGKRNSSIAIVGKVRTVQDASQPLAALPARVDPTKLTDNQLYVETGDDDHRAVRAKVTALYGEDRIAAYALACSGWQTSLVPEYAAQLAHYADRWNPLRHEALVAGCRSRGWTWPADPATLGGQTGPDRPAHQSGPVATQTGPDRTTGPDQTEARTGNSDRTGPVRTASEAPMSSPNTEPDRSDGPVVDWTDADRSALAALGITLDGPADNPGPAAGEVPQVDVAGVRRLAEQVLAGHLERVANRPDLPDPLGPCAALAADPKAPEFIPTATLALALGRISAADPPERRKQAAERLGRELTSQAPWLQSVQKSMGSDASGKRVRPWGFMRDDLTAAAGRWWDGQDAAS